MRPKRKPRATDLARRIADQAREAYLVAEDIAAGAREVDADVLGLMGESLWRAHDALLKLARCRREEPTL